MLYPAGSRALWVAASLGLGVPVALAYDHQDSVSVRADPSVDLTSLHTWMGDGKLVVAVGVNPNATTSTRFSAAALYTVHIHRGAAYRMPTSETTIVCRFDAAQIITCWPGDDRTETTTGDASNPNGILSASGRFRVFASPRADPEQVYVDGYQRMVTAFDALVPTLPINGAGCPTGLEPARSTELLTTLRQTPEGTDAISTFADSNVLSIVMELDVSLLRGAGDILSVWASTNAR